MFVALRIFRYMLCFVAERRSGKWVLQIGRVMLEQLMKGLM